MNHTDNEIWYAEQRDLAIEERDAALARAEAAEMMAGKWLQLVTLRDNLIFELEAERDAAVARAEAAEADLGELRENTLLALGMSPLDVQDGLEDSTIMLVVNGLVEANAALREQLAALQWRPVTEEPTPWEIVEVIGLGYRRGVEGDDEWIGVEYPEAWRPRPTPPLGR